MNSTSLHFDDTKLTYYSDGTGFPVIFLHGFCEDHTVWSWPDEAHEFVKPFANNYRVILPDTPGSGQSVLGKEIEGKVSMDYYADCIKAILDAENITSCVMVGHSMGGYITLNFASRFPEYLKGFALFHSTAYPDDETKKKDRERVAEFVRKNGSENFINELYKNLFGAAFKDQHANTINALKNYAVTVSAIEGIAAASLAMRDRRDTTEVLKQSKVPVLFIIGKEDKAVNPEKTMELTHLPDRAVITILERAGHMGMFEEPEKSGSAINEWLSLVEV